MKIIHCSDIHLDSKINGLPHDKSKVRKEEILRSFEKMCLYAKNNGVTAIIIAGDMFDCKKITIKTRERVVKTIEQCSDIDFLYLKGNHDEDSFIDSIEVVPNNLKIFGTKWTTFSYDTVKITGVAFDGLNTKTIYDTLSLNKEDINIVVMHGQIVGYSSKDKAEIISLPLLKEKNIDYLALGHIHSHDSGKLDNRGLYAYSGCLDGRGFDELGEKGFYLLNIENNKVEPMFIPFSSRQFHEFTYSIDGKNNFFEIKNDIISTLKRECKPNDLIKVIVKGEHTVDLVLDFESLSMQLNEEFFFAKIYDKTILKVSADDFSLDKTIRGEFVRTVLNSNLSEEEKNSIIMIGLNALKGEDLI